MDNQGFFQFNYLIYRYLQAFALSDDDLSAIRLAVVYPEIRFLYPHYMTILGYECFIWPSLSALERTWDALRPVILGNKTWEVVINIFMIPALTS